MTQREMVETIQQLHPEVSINRILKMLNQAQDDFCRKTEIIDTSLYTSIVSGQRYYDLNRKINNVWRVDVDDEQADHLAGQPAKTDIS
jgi:predicted transcriptional regulator|tara:strand:+ start:8145 stop:8408 length:264 start_codon:yes stop_codon:yes gene_type:complete